MSAPREIGRSGSGSAPARPRLVLGIETSTPWGGAALMESSGRLLGHLWAHARTGYSRRLMPGIDFLLREAGFGPRDLSAIAVTHGPGSFTGVRIGLVTAKTLAQSLDIPLYTFCTLEALARRWPIASEPIAIFMDARRKEIYSGIFSHTPGGRTEAFRETAVEPPEQFVETLRVLQGREIWLAGDAVEKFRPLWEPALGDRARPMSLPWRLPAADSVARMGVGALESQATPTDPLTAIPQYIRASDAWRIGQS